MVNSTAVFVGFTLLVLVAVSHVEAQYQQPPAASYAPLLAGMIKVVDIPAYGSPTQPAIIGPDKQLQRRAGDYPPAPELSRPLAQKAAPSDPWGRRRLLSQRWTDASTRSWFRRLAGAETPLVIDSSQDSRGSNSHRQSEGGSPGLAIGLNHLITTISTAITITSFDPTTATSSEPTKHIALADLFGPVGSSNCLEGVHDASPLYDVHARRYLITAVCGGTGLVLLAASATSDALGQWFLYALAADAGGTGLACRAPEEGAVADWVKPSYNQDGVYISLFNYCPSSPATQGAVLLALPKHRVYKGSPTFVYGVFSATNILAALPPLERGGLVPAQIRQCQPAVPQTQEDAARGQVHYVCDHLGHSVNPKSSFILATLINTGALWQYNGKPDSATPFLVAAVAQRSQPVVIDPSAKLLQPGGEHALAAGGNTPSGFWQGGAAFSGGKLLVVERTDVAAAGASEAGSSSPRPSLLWSEYQLVVATASTGDCSKTRDWGGKWDWSVDWSIDWGKDFDQKWEDHKTAGQALGEQVAEAAALGLLGDTPTSAAAATAAAGGQDPAAAAGSGQGQAAEVIQEPGALATAIAAVISRIGGSAVPLGGTSSRADTSRDPAAGGSSTGLAQPDSEWAGKAPQQLPPAEPEGTKSSILQHLRSDTLFGNFGRRKLAMYYYGYNRGGCYGYCYYGGGYYYTGYWYYGWYGNYYGGYGYAVGYKYVGYYKGPYYYGYDGVYAGIGYGKWYGTYPYFGKRRLLQQPSPHTGDGTGDSTIVPPCLQQGSSPTDTCRSCDYSGYAAEVAVPAVLRGGLLTVGGGWPLALTAAGVAVSQGVIQLVYSYSGPGQLPGAAGAPAYFGIAHTSIPPGTSETGPINILKLGAAVVTSTPYWAGRAAVQTHPATGKVHYAAKYAHGPLASPPSSSTSSTEPTGLEGPGAIGAEGTSAEQTEVVAAAPGVAALKASAVGPAAAPAAVAASSSLAAEDAGAELYGSDPATVPAPGGAAGGGSLVQEGLLDEGNGSSRTGAVFVDVLNDGS